MDLRQYQGYLEEGQGLLVDLALVGLEPPENAGPTWLSALTQMSKENHPWL